MRTVVYVAIVIASSSAFAQKPTSQPSSTAPTQPATIGQPVTPTAPQIAIGDTPRLAGAPPAPLAVAPSLATAISAWSADFRWQPGAGDPVATFFQLCIAQAGTNCARPGQPSATSIVISNIAANTSALRLTGDRLASLLTYGQTKSLTWTISACAPGGISVRIMGGVAAPVCTSSRPVRFSWQLLLAAPELSPPQSPLINDRPRLSIQRPIEGAHHYLFCLVAVPVGTPPAGSLDATGACPYYTRGSAIHVVGATIAYGNNIAVVNTGPSLSTSGWEWKSEQSIPFISTPVPVVGISVGYGGGGGVEWTVGACPNERDPCSWAQPMRLARFPVGERIPIVPIQESPSRFRLEWRGVAAEAVSHYRVCLATSGSTFPLLHFTYYKLIYYPGMLRDLCSDSAEVPPGQLPVYQQQLPPVVASSCPSGGCVMPRPVATYVAGAGPPRYILDLREHPELANFHGQTLALIVAPCSGSNRNCEWDQAFSEIQIPTYSRDPEPVVSGVSPQSFVINWQTWWGNTYYIPCVREANTTCETGNLLSRPRMDAPRVGTPQDHPRTCSLSGPALSGLKTVQVAGCNDAWGCRWSPPRQQSFSAIRLPPSQSALVCR